MGEAKRGVTGESAKIFRAQFRDSVSGLAFLIKRRARKCGSPPPKPEPPCPPLERNPWMDVKLRNLPPVDPPVLVRRKRVLPTTPQRELSLSNVSPVAAL